MTSRRRALLGLSGGGGSEVPHLFRGRVSGVSAVTGCRASHIDGFISDVLGQVADLLC